jgi:hypothetical protein
LYSRLTLVVRDGHIEHAFHPIFPPNTNARQVLAWLDVHPASSRMAPSSDAPERAGEQLSLMGRHVRGREAAHWPRW